MIKIRTPAADIEKQVAEHLPRWKTHADGRTEEDIAAGRHIERKNDIWSQLKPFISAAQLKKCAYCESVLGKIGVRWQVEHYRPKSRVDAWGPRWPGFADQPSSARGYYRLAYDIGNYLGSCESCNNHKRNYFPVLAARQTSTSESSVLASERPLLINPIDVHDGDPEELIEFYGPVPWPRQEAGSSRLRALATIEVLRLGREDLVVARCERVYAAWTAYKHRDDEGVEGDLAREFLDIVAESRCSHCNCIRSFLRLCESNPDEALYLLNLAMGVLRERISYKAVTEIALERRTRSALQSRAAARRGNRPAAALRFIRRSSRP